MVVCRDIYRPQQDFSRLPEFVNLGSAFPDIGGLFWPICECIDNILNNIFTYRQQKKINLVLKKAVIRQDEATH